MMLHRGSLALTREWSLHSWIWKFYLHFLFFRSLEGIKKGQLKIINFLYPVYWMFPPAKILESKELNIKRKNCNWGHNIFIYYNKPLTYHKTCLKYSFCRLDFVLLGLIFCAKAIALWLSHSSKFSPSQKDNQ